MNNNLKITDAIGYQGSREAAAAARKDAPENISSGPTGMPCHPSTPPQLSSNLQERTEDQLPAKSEEFPERRGRMSRHKLIRNLDLDDELDDFDGGEDYDYDGGDVVVQGT